MRHDKILRFKNTFVIIVTGHSVGVWRCAAANAAEGSVAAPSCGGGCAAANAAEGSVAAPSCGGGCAAANAAEGSVAAPSCGGGRQCGCSVLWRRLCSDDCLAVTCGPLLRLHSWPVASTCLSAGDSITTGQL